MQQKSILQGNRNPRYFIIAALMIMGFYLVGIVGILSPMRDMVLPLTPVNLLLTAACLFLFHERWSRKFVLFALTAMAIGYGIEVLGVHTGLVFGHYHYGANLGPKVWEVPPIIGLNWLLLVYSIGCVVGRYILYSPTLQALSGATLMTALDVLIEPVAMQSDFWNWQGSVVPAQNYAGWWVVSYVLFYLFFALRLQDKNPMAPVIIALQGIFFGILYCTL